jgi:hypothetical protein
LNHGIFCWNGNVLIYFLGRRIEPSILPLH